MARYTRKNEFRMDLNKKHYGKDKKPHPAYIFAQNGNFYRANTITHSLYTTTGEHTRRINENPNKNKGQTKKYSRVSPAFWQHKKMFSNKKLNNYSYNQKSIDRIISFNKF